MSELNPRGCVSDYEKEIRLSRVLGGAGHRSLIVVPDQALAVAAFPGTSVVAVKTISRRGMTKFLAFSRLDFHKQQG